MSSQFSHKFSSFFTREIDRDTVNALCGSNEDFALLFGGHDSIVVKSG